MSLVKITNLKKYFAIKSGFLNRETGSIKALDGIDLEVKEGETLGLVGESGCGKSTLGRVLLKLLPASSGKVEFMGRDLSGLSEAQMKDVRKDIQIVFQNPYASLDPRMTIREILSEPFQVHGIASGVELDKKVEELISLVGLSTPMLDRYPHEFSGGQRQRVGIARALALRPKLIVADEPVSALDVSVQAQILNLLLNLKKEFNLTYLFIAHNLDVVRYISDRVAVMYLGRVVEIGDCQTVYNKPLHPYSKALISAAPVPDPEFANSERIILVGDLPSPANPPSGCRFHTRCPMVQDKCRVDDPVLREIEPGHFSACHFAEDLL